MSDSPPAPDLGRGSGTGLGPYRQASELARFAFCRRAWWLERVMGVEPINRAARERGTQAHAEVGRDLRLAGRRRGWALVLLAVAMGLVWVAMGGG